MRWEEDSNDEAVAPAADAVDVAFRLSGRWLPVDHAHALRNEVLKVLPWLEDEPVAGIHPIHGAASGNGWERPGRESAEMLPLSRRTRLLLRVPAGRAGETTALCERRLDIDGCEVVTGTRQPRPLSPAGTVFARYVVDEAGRGRGTLRGARRVRRWKRFRCRRASSCAGARIESNRRGPCSAPGAC